MRIFFTLLGFLMLSVKAWSQDIGYEHAPTVMTTMLEAPYTPVVSLSPASASPRMLAINPAAFLPVTATFQGNVARNSLRGFGLLQQDLSLQRELPITNRFAAQLRAEILNVTNRPNFGNPGTGSTNTNVLNAAGFGLSSMSLSQSLGAGGADGGFNPIYQTGGPRAIQLVLKLSF